MVDFTTRQRAVFQADLFQLPISIIGAGGMGSSIATSLVRMGLGQKQSPIYLFDGDKFERHNLANQQVFDNQVGRSKVSVVRENMLAINPACTVIDRKQMIMDSTGLEGIVFMCVDRMEARANIMETCLEKNKLVECVIETRMDARVGISHCFDPNNKRHCDCWWEQQYLDSQADNMAGCGGNVSIISAVLGTTMLALKQFEMFARTGRPYHMPNRLYQDFDQAKIKSLEWSTHPKWD